MGPLIGYHGTSEESWVKIKRVGCLLPTSRIDIFSNRHDRREDLQPWEFLGDMVIPDFAYRRYSFFVDSIDAGERFYDLIPSEPSYDKARDFLQKFIEKRKKVVIRAELPLDSTYVIDFSQLLPAYARLMSRHDAWQNYLGTFTSLEEYSQGDYLMPEFLVAASIPIENIEPLL
jgi:hypothetical protein